MRNKNKIAIAGITLGAVLFTSLFITNKPVPAIEQEYEIVEMTVNTSIGGYDIAFMEGDEMKSLHFDGFHIDRNATQPIVTLTENGTYNYVVPAYDF